ncbi:MAG: DedD protein [Cellvibrionaceae bacterium]
MELSLEENLKQRLVGAAVLVALAVIFLPALFDKDERTAINTTSLIPPAPVIDPVVVARPNKPETIKIPPAEELFQHGFVEEDIKSDDTDENKQADDTNLVSSTVKPEIKPAPKQKIKPTLKSKPAATEGKPKPVVSKPTLSSSGVPVGWVVQAASFKSAQTAKNFNDKLIKADYKAYFKSVDTAKGKYFRVFTGPYIDEQQAIDTKRVIDKAYKVSSRVLRFNPASNK